MRSRFSGNRSTRKPSGFVGLSGSPLISAYRSRDFCDKFGIRKLLDDRGVVMFGRAVVFLPVVVAGHPEIAGGDFLVQLGFDRCQPLLFFGRQPAARTANSELFTSTFASSSGVPS